jgi:hypothetical protein
VRRRQQVARARGERRRSRVARCGQRQKLMEERERERERWTVTVTF